MPDNQVTLHNSCGLFIKVKGTDQVIHLDRYWPHTVDESTELWELTTLRLLRRAISEGKIQELETEKTSLNLFVSLLLFHLAKKERREVEIHESCCGISVYYEALKFWQTIHKQSNIAFKFHAAFRTKGVEDTFNFLHKEIEDNVFLKTLGNIAYDSDQIGLISKQLENGAIVVLSTLKHNAQIIPEVFKVLSDNEDTRNGSILLIFRATRGAPTTVFDIQTNKYELPSLFPTLKTLSDHGWHLSYFYAHNFDKDYLLPFDGDQGICILHAAGTAEKLINGFSFSCYSGQSDNLQQDTIIPYDERILNSHEAFFSWDLPAFELQSEPDWRQWADEWRWDPSQIAWDQCSIDNSDEVAIISRMARYGEVLSPVTGMQFRDRLLLAHQSGTLTLQGALCLLELQVALGDQNTKPIIEGIFLNTLNLLQLEKLSETFAHMNQNYGFELAVLHFALQAESQKKSNLLLEAKVFSTKFLNHFPQSIISLITLGVADFGLGGNEYSQFFKQASELDPSNMYLKKATHALQKNS